MAELRTTVRRHHVIWHHWQLQHIRDDGFAVLIAEGAELSQQKALFAAQSWQRVWLRRNGRLNYAVTQPVHLAGTRSPASFPE